LLLASDTRSHSCHNTTMVQSMCLTQAVPRLHHPSFPWTARTSGTCILISFISGTPHLHSSAVRGGFVCCASPLFIQRCSPFGLTVVSYFGIHDARAGQGLDKHGKAPKQPNDAGVAREDRGGTRRIRQVRLVFGSRTVFRQVACRLFCGGIKHPVMP
jgi:hypothetical protein